jgi:hypothetical protein
MDQSSIEEQKYGRCKRCKQLSTSIVCKTCDLNLKEREYGKCRSCEQIKPINTGMRFCLACTLKFREIYMEDV